jgi:single-strand DNA-binding protein
MPKSVNEVTIIGNLGKDAETKFTQSGTSVANFSVATSRSWKDKQSGEWKEQTEWHRIVLWQAEKLAPFLLKGKQVYIKGHLQTRSYDDKEGRKVYTTEIVADDVMLLGGRDGDKSDRTDQPVSMPRSAKPAEPPHAYAQPQGGAISDDDVPFMRYEVPCL